MGNTQSIAPIQPPVEHPVKPNVKNVCGSSFKNKKGSDKPYQETTKQNWNDCCVWCSTDPKCGAWSYKASSDLCQKFQSSNLKSAPGYRSGIVGKSSGIGGNSSSTFVAQGSYNLSTGGLRLVKIGNRLASKQQSTASVDLTDRWKLETSVAPGKYKIRTHARPFLYLAASGNNVTLKTTQGGSSWGIKKRDSGYTIEHLDTGKYLHMDGIAVKLKNGLTVWTLTSTEGAGDLAKEATAALQGANQLVERANKALIQQAQRIMKPGFGKRYKKLQSMSVGSNPLITGKILTAFTIGDGFGTKRMPVYDQGEQGSCTANAIAMALRYSVFLWSKGSRDDNWSRRWIYWLARFRRPVDFISQECETLRQQTLQLYASGQDPNKVLKQYEACLGEDTGSIISVAMVLLKAYGWLPEDAWPYDPDNASQMPGNVRISEALKTKSAFTEVAIEELRSIRDIEISICQGLPVVIGFNVFQNSFPDNGECPGIQPGAEIKGGHAVLIIGYDRGKQRCVIQNSWGRDWGNDGYGTIPYSWFSPPVSQGSYGYRFRIQKA